MAIPSSRRGYGIGSSSFIVIVLTFGGLLIAHQPIFPAIRDDVYLWLQSGRRPQKSVVIVAIDDTSFRGTELGGNTPLDREYLAKLLRKIATADPAVIALDVKLMSDAPPPAMDLPGRVEKTSKLLNAVRDIAERCPVVLPRTVHGEHQYQLLHDVYDGFDFCGHDVRFGHTSAAVDRRQIPIRSKLRKGGTIDSFAYAIFLASEPEGLPEYEAERTPWPYSYFFSASLFTPGVVRRTTPLLTSDRVLAASQHEIRSWLRTKIVLVGGMWHDNPQTVDGEIVDSRPTPVGMLPGVVTHANYVQSLLWGAMHPMAEWKRIGIETLLAFIVSVIFLRSSGIKRIRNIAFVLLAVVCMTWIFSRAIGIFFEMVVPILLLGIHVLLEGIEPNVHVTLPPILSHRPRLMDTVWAAVATGLVVAVGLQLYANDGNNLRCEERLQVALAQPAPAPLLTPARENSAPQVASLHDANKRRHASHSHPSAPIAFATAPSAVYDLSTLMLRSSPNALLQIGDITGTTVAAAQWRNEVASSAVDHPWIDPILYSYDEDLSQLIAQMHVDLNRYNSRELASKPAMALSMRIAGTRDREFSVRARALFAPLLNSTLRTPVVGFSQLELANSWRAQADGDSPLHKGIDIFAERGTEVVAVTDGTISFIGDQKLGGHCLWLTTENGKSFYYAHLDHWAAGIQEGMTVQSGDLLGYVGNSGAAAIHSPPHLHFAINGDDHIGTSPFDDYPVYAQIAAVWRFQQSSQPR